MPWMRWGAVAVALAVAFLAIPPLAHAPARLVEGCGTWIALGAVLELLSILGFVLVFALVFGVSMTGRQKLSTGLRALGASTVLPAGGLVGPAIGARTARTGSGPQRLVRATIAFTILTNAPSLVVLGALSVSLWLGWPAGPHAALLTLPAAALAWGLIGAGWLIGGPALRGSAGTPPRHAARLQIWVALKTLRDGAAEARLLVTTGNWKLAGAVSYYAFDNAVLWAAFHAYGHTPAPSVIVMGYLVGSLGAAVPLPAGIGVVEGGLIGALVLYGAPVAPAAGAVLLYRGVSILLPVALGAVAWALVPAERLRQVRRHRARTPIPAPAARVGGAPIAVREGRTPSAMRVGRSRQRDRGRPKLRAATGDGVDPVDAWK